MLQERPASDFDEAFWYFFGKRSETGSQTASQDHNGQAHTSNR
jgi:hypothetical protein